MAKLNRMAIVIQARVWLTFQTIEYMYSFIFVCVNPLHPNIDIDILHTVSFYNSSGTDKENLFDNQELPKLVIISFILMTFTYDSRVILWGEIRSQSLLIVKGSKGVLEETCKVALFCFEFN